MQRKMITIVLTICLISSLFAQELSKEEETIKQSIIKAGHAYLNRDFNEWQKWTVQDDSYYLLSANINTFVEIFGWDSLVENNEDWFAQGMRETPEPQPENFKIIVDKNMAFVTFYWDSNKQVRVMVKEDGIWKEMYVGMVNTWGYERVKNLNYLQRFDGDWELDVASVKYEGASLDVTHGKLTISSSMDRIEHIIHTNHKGSGQGWTATHNWQYAIHNDNSIQVMSQVITSNYQTWVHLGIAELADDILTAKVNRKNDPDDELLVRTFVLKDVDTINETQEWFVNGKKTRMVSWSWKR